MGNMHAGIGHWIARGFVRGSEAISSYSKLSRRTDVGLSV